ncbi:MAG TPA: DinB family protein [Bryobacteraceae bacterium]|nr:DinB family protein [Bryobacteraceae bacterium]
MRIPRSILCLVAIPLLAGPLNQGDRDFALSQLHATRKMVLDAIDGLSEAQWKFKPAPDRWSIAEIVEHLILTEESMMGWTKKVLETPAVEGRSASRAADEKLYAGYLDRSHKASAPAELRPSTGNWPTPAAAAQEFASRRDRTLEYVRTTQDDLRGHLTKGPGGDMDAYQMVLLNAAHTERHMAQLNEVKAAPGYPTARK